VGYAYLFHYVRTELLLAELRDATEERATKWLGEWFLAQVEDVLQDVVAEWILHKREGATSDGCDKLCPLISRSMIDAALNDAATMTMSANHNTVHCDSIEDELRILA